MRESQPVAGDSQEEAVEIGVDRAWERVADVASCLEIHLKARYEVDVQRVDVANHRSELVPSPRRHATTESLGAPVVRIVQERHSVVGFGDFNEAIGRRTVGEPVQKAVGFRGEVFPYLY